MIASSTNFEVAMSINLKTLRTLQSAGGVLRNAPNTPIESMDIPEDIKEAWKSYLDAKEYFNQVLDKYDISPVK